MNTKTKGIIFIILSAFFFALMNAFVRLSGDLPSVQKSFFRNLVAVVFALVILLKSEQKFHFDRGNLKFLLLRSIFGTTGILGNYYAVDHMLLSDATMLGKLAPFFAVIASFFFLKEKLSLFQVLAVIAAFGGSLFIIKPSASAFADSLPALVGLLGGLSAGLAYTTVRYLSNRGERGPFIVFFFSAFSCLATLPFLLFDFHPMTWQQLCFLLLAGLAAAGGQFTVTAAYSCAPAREISVFDYTQVLFSALLGFFLFGQVPDGWSFLGYFLICGISAAMFFYNKRRSVARPAKRGGEPPRANAIRRQSK